MMDTLTKLDCIDTFSGIGGIALGLRDFTNVVQYCEWDSYCQQVLIERMEDGRLDRAPIHSDVKNLHISSRIRPRMITGGFPCQDISTIGLQKGIVEGERSSMFYHIMRVVDECPSIDVVFLENVANIVNCGLKEVVDELAVRRGFNVQWKVFTATEFGAPHVRARWFCLACKPGVDLANVVRDHMQPRPNESFWEGSEPCTRVTLRKDDNTYDSNWIQRCHTLGNTVVPQVVREAFIDLASSSAKWATMAECLDQFRVPCCISEVNNPFPESALVYNGNMYMMPRRVTFGSKSSQKPVEITLNNGAIRMQHFPTPRRGITHPSSCTDRTIRDLPTVLVHCDQVREYLKERLGDNTSPIHSVAVPNVNYIEWMMGFDADWTKTRVSKWRYCYKYAEQIGDSETVCCQDEENGEDTSLSEKPSVRKRVRVSGGHSRLNGLHMLMRDLPGKDIRTIAAAWKSLTDDERKRYSDKARQESHNKETDKKETDTYEA